MADAQSADTKHTLIRHPGNDLPGDPRHGGRFRFVEKGHLGGGRRAGEARARLQYVHALLLARGGAAVHQLEDLVLVLLVLLVLVLHVGVEQVLGDLRAGLRRLGELRELLVEELAKLRVAMRWGDTR